MPAPWRYAVTWTHSKTGEKKRVVVTLTDAERHDALLHTTPHRLNGPGGSCGPIVNNYAMRHAAAGLDEAWCYDMPKIEPIDLSLVH